MFASSADQSWNSWGAKPSYLPFIHELTFYGMGRGTLGSGAGLTLEVGSVLSLPGDLAPAGPWTGPHEQRITVMQEVRDGRTVLAGPALTTAGVYGPATGDTRAVVAVNPEGREADVRHVTREQMAAALGVEVKNMMERPTRIAWETAGTGQGSWLGPSLVLGALGLFLLEAILALAFSMYR
jgi:hypothetical protein